MAPRPADRQLDTTPTWVRRLWDTPWLWLALIIPLFCAPLFIGLDRTDLDNDEAIYSFAVETMLRDGDWLTPKSIPSETSAFLEKPPLKFWITYVPMRLGLLPDDEFGLRFMDAAMGALAFLYVFGIGRRIAGPVCGITAVMLLFAHGALLHHHGLRSNNMESTTVLAYAAAVYHFLAWRSVNPDVKRHIYAMSLWFVFGFMTKFVAALFLPVILGIAALLKHEDRGRLYRDWKTFAMAALLAVALIVPWFAYQYVQRGPRLFAIMFSAHIVKRFTAYLDPVHLHPWNYYFTELWSELRQAGTRLLISIGAVLFVARTVQRRWTEGAVVVLWFVIPMAAISTGTSKLYHYAYPFLAPVALAGGWLLAGIAARVYRWIATPIGIAVRRRDSMLPGWLRSQRLQIGLTITGLVSLAVAAATAGVDRLQVTLGGFSIRNSSVIRPALVTLLTWLPGAPPQILRGAVVAGLLALALPLSAYHENIAVARIPDRPMQALRECLEPIVAEQVGRGHTAPGAWVEARSISYIPLYYLQVVGPWQQRDGESDVAVIKHLLAPNDFRLVVLSADRYRRFMNRLGTDYAALMERAARDAAVDVSILTNSVEENRVGLLVFKSDTFMLPGPYASCGQERVRLVYR